jgi:hypothetical protein
VIYASQLILLRVVKLMRLQKIEYDQIEERNTDRTLEALQVSCLLHYDPLACQNIVYKQI